MGKVQLQALVEGKKLIVMKHLAKTTAWNEYSSTMASAIICLATNQKFNFSKYIFESMVKNLDNAGKFLMYPRFVQVFLEKQLEGMQSHKRIYVTPSHTKKIFGNMRRVGKGFSRRDTPLFPTMMVQAQQEQGEGSAMPTDPYHTPTIIQSSTSQPQLKQRSRRPKRKDTHVSQPSGPTTNVADKAINEEMNDCLVRAATIAFSLEVEQDSASLGDQEDASKQGRKINDIDKDAEITLVDETQGRYGDDIMFDVSDLTGEEVFVAEQGVPDSKKDDDAQVNTAPTTITAASTRPRAKGLVIHEQEQAPIPIKLSKKDQLKLDEEVAQRLQAEFDEQERIEREKAKANIALKETWDDIQAKIKADQLLAERLQEREQEDLTIEERVILFQQLLEKRRKHFAAKRSKEKRNRPPTKAQ
ncbi:hypothetical protein Tco_0570820 [Tanacetum coccineum]